MAQKSRSETVAAGAAAVLVTVLLAAAPAAAQEGWQNPDCDPEVEAVIEAGAKAGVEADTAAIRDPDLGIRNPDSIFDFSCIEDLFNFRLHNVLFDPGRSMTQILGLVQRQLCSTARQAYRRYVGRPVDPGLWAARQARLPGLGTRLLETEPIQIDHYQPPGPEFIPPRRGDPPPLPPDRGAAPTQDRMRSIYGGGR